MSLMTRASEIAPNVYVGPTPDPTMLPLSGAPGGTEYDVLIEATDLAQMPDAVAIESLKRDPERQRRRKRYAHRDTRFGEHNAANVESCY